MIVHLCYRCGKPVIDDGTGIRRIYCPKCDLENFGTLCALDVLDRAPGELIHDNHLGDPFPDPHLFFDAAGLPVREGSLDDPPRRKLEPNP